MDALEGHVLVAGLGVSGLAVARYVATRIAQGDPVTLTAVDSAETADLIAATAPLVSAGLDVRLGVTELEGSYDLAIVSPGVKPHSTLMRAVRRSSGEVIGELEFAFRRSRSPWIAVTGTNGKTTTTSLIAHLLSSAGVAAELAGNIGTPAIDVVAEAGPATTIVAEVSSFQLNLAEEFHPRVAVLLNITPDHLDWHGSMDAYIADKARVFANLDADDFAVVDVDDPGAAPFAEELRSRGLNVLRVSRRSVPDGGAGFRDGTLVLATRGERVELVRADELRIRGDHNVSNALAAAAAAHAFGVDPAALREGLASFEPIEHRLEPAGEVEGVEYFNDSKATNPDAVLKALTAFPDRDIVLLLGGRNKDNTFDELAEAVCARCRAVVTFGEAGPEIDAALTAAGCESVPARTMADAVARARSLAGPGDVVLLSPACASFDEFSDFEHRGRVFKRLVQLLAEEVARGVS